jgi:hypothetical protein
MSTVRTVPRFFKPDVHLNMQPIEVPRLENCKNSVLNSLVLRELYFRVVVLS